MKNTTDSTKIEQKMHDLMFFIAYYTLSDILDQILGSQQYTSTF